MNTPRISDKLAFPSFMTDFFFSCTELGEGNTGFRLFFLAIHDEVLMYHSPSTCFGFFGVLFSVPGEMHTEQVSIDGRLNESLGEVKGQTGTIIYLIQSRDILLNSILPNFFPYCI